MIQYIEKPYYGSNVLGLNTRAAYPTVPSNDKKTNVF